MKWLAVALLMTFSTGANAGMPPPFVVNSSADLPHEDIDPDGGNACVAVGGLCTLRAAIQAANANPGPDEITFDILGNIGLVFGQANEDSAVGGDLDIRCSALPCAGDESLKITGDPTSLTVIEAMGLPDRAFHIVDDIAVTIENIEVRNTNAAMDIGDGTAIWNLGRLTLRNVTVRGSSGLVLDTGEVVLSEGAILNSGTMTLDDVRVVDNIGTGINCGPGQLSATDLVVSGNSVVGLRVIDPNALVTVTDSKFSQNGIGFWTSAGRASVVGVNEDGCEISNNLSGGVRNDSLLFIERCEIASNDSQVANGGGILNLGTLELLDSRVTDNTVGLFEGGGMQNSGRAVVRGSLFSNNTAAVGGGIANTGTLMVVNTTVSGNEGTGGISTRDDGFNSELRVFSSTVVKNGLVDLHQSGTADIIEVRNSIVARCLVSDGTASIVSLDFNFELGTSCGFDEENDVQTIEDLIGGTIASDLAPNGGFTQTHKLLAGASTSGIDRNDRVSCPLTDQRGMPRGLDLPSTMDSSKCDTGAYEAEASSVSECSDGKDNDGDGFVDLADVDACSSASDNLELSLDSGRFLFDGTILAASDDGSAVFAIVPDPDRTREMEMDGSQLKSVTTRITRGSGLRGPISVTGKDTDILVLDAFQGLVFQIDLETGIPKVFSSTGNLDFPIDLAYGPDGDLFVVGRVISGTATIVRIDPMTRVASAVPHSPQLTNPHSIDFDQNGDFFVSNRSDGVYRVVLDDQGIGVAERIDGVSDPSGLEVRRSGELLVVNRATNDVVALDPGPAGDAVPIGIADLDPMVLESPRGLAIELEFGRPSDSLVQVTMIVSERAGKLHRIEWDGTTPTTSVIVDGLPSLFGVWIMRDQDRDGILDADDDSDADGLTDEFETNSGIFIDSAHPGTAPDDDDSDDDNLLDGFEAASGFDPLSAGADCDPADPDRPGCDDTQDPDADGLTNLQEQTAGTNPIDDDSDGDNLLDGFELTNGFDPLSAGADCDAGDPARPGCDDTQDPDGDGFTNLQEQMAGTDPNDGDDFLFANGIPAMGPMGLWILAPLLLLASRFLFSRRPIARGR